MDALKQAVEVKGTDKLNCGIWERAVIRDLERTNLDPDVKNEPRPALTETRSEFIPGLIITFLVLLPSKAYLCLRSFFCY